MSMHYIASIFCVFCVGFGQETGKLAFRCKAFTTLLTDEIIPVIESTTRVY